MISEPRRDGAGARLILHTLILALSVAIAGYALREALALVLAESDPVRAAGIAPRNARAAMAAARFILEQGGAATGADVVRLTQVALRRDATSTAAIELRALQAQSLGQQRTEASLFHLSDRISRRSLATRLWLIQQSVDKGDVEGALEDFDIALRTSSKAPPILFPVLDRAASDPGLIQPIARILDRPEEWRQMFFVHAIEHGATPQLVQLALAMHDRGAIQADGIDRLLIGRLVEEGDFADARRLDARFRKPASSTLVEDPDFSDPSRLFPFGWSLTDKGAIQAERGIVAARPALLYRAAAGGSDQLAAQLLTLPSGRYRLSAHAAAGPAVGSPPYWSVVCAKAGGAVLALLDQPATGSARTDYAVPPACVGQWLVLRLRPGDTGQSGAISKVGIERLQD